MLNVRLHRLHSGTTMACALNYAPESFCTRDEQSPNIQNVHMPQLKHMLCVLMLHGSMCNGSIGKALAACLRCIACKSAKLYKSLQCLPGLLCSAAKLCHLRHSSGQQGRLDVWGCWASQICPGSSEHHSATSELSPTYKQIVGK